MIIPVLSYIHHLQYPFWQNGQIYLFFLSLIHTFAVNLSLYYEENRILGCFMQHECVRNGTKDTCGHSQHTGHGEERTGRYHLVSSHRRWPRCATVCGIKCGILRFRWSTTEYHQQHHSGLH